MGGRAPLERGPAAWGAHLDAQESGTPLGRRAAQSCGGTPEAARRSASSAGGSSFPGRAGGRGCGRPALGQSSGTAKEPGSGARGLGSAGSPRAGPNRRGGRLGADTPSPALPTGSGEAAKALTAARPPSSPRGNAGGTPRRAHRGGQQPWAHHRRPARTSSASPGADGLAGRGAARGTTAEEADEARRHHPRRARAGEGRRRARHGRKRDAADAQRRSGSLAAQPRGAASRKGRRGAPPRPWRKGEGSNAASLATGHPGGRPRARELGERTAGLLFSRRRSLAREGRDRGG